MIIRLLILVFILFPGTTCFAELKILEGEHTVVYDIVNPRGVAFIPNYSNESFSQKVVDLDEFSKRVTVRSTMHKMKTRVPYPIPAGMVNRSYQQFLMPERDRQSSDPGLMKLAHEIVSGSRYEYEAANSILTWIADNLTFDTTVSVPSDAVSAYRYRKAYCVGYSNLAVALLRAAGIPARVAHGYLPPGYEWGFSKEYWGVKVNDGGFHAYLEIFYPDTGWVFSDAEHSHFFVDPFHIILRLDGMDMPGAYKGGFLDVDKATFYTIYKEENKTSMVDELPLPKHQRLGRRMSDEQHASLITGKVSDKNGAVVAKGVAVLWKDGRGTQYPFTDGKYAVAVPLSGSYRIEVKGPGFAKASKELQVVRGKVYQRDFTLPPGGTILGRVLDSAGRPAKDGDVFYQAGNTSYGVPIDQDGTYRIDGLSPGRYKITVSVGDKGASQFVTVEAGKESVHDFTVR